MDFRQSLEYLYGLNTFGIKLGLHNMRALQERLPELQTDPPLIHVAGTNGKGSVSVLLAEILRQSGLRVGLYTSPHLHCLTERIRVDGQPIAPQEVADLTTELRSVSQGIPLTFFEMTTAMTLLAFRRRQVDWAVLETGLGGRLDATNIVRPRLSLITPISFDHQRHLGTTLEQIAAEKAGIIKTGVPVVIGRQPAEARAVLSRVAEKMAAPVTLAGRDFSWIGSQQDLRVTVDDQTWTGLDLALPGEHQCDNFAQAIAAACRLKEQGATVTTAAIRRAGRTVRWPGRLEWWGGRQVLLDAAHNGAGATCLAGYLRQQGLDRVPLLCALSGERSVDDVFGPLRERIAELFVVPIPEMPHVPVAGIVRWGEAQRLRSHGFATVEAGLAAALANRSDRQPLVVCGSIYLLAIVRGLLQNNFPTPATGLVPVAQAI
ncbi:MAG: folylpolyglutamate synthase/dihydrofolate synthase family protein [Desulfuromonadales bacterium]|nr:folylpolyglutamate synthase/dihydrofolate synthase family protein [Desulfuromonadales bacterium]